MYCFELEREAGCVVKGRSCVQLMLFKLKATLGKKKKITAGVVLLIDTLP